MESQKAYLESKVISNAISNIEKQGNYKIKVEHMEPIESIKFPPACFVNIETVGGIGKSSMSRIVKNPDEYLVEGNMWELFDKMEEFAKK